MLSLALSLLACSTLRCGPGTAEKDGLCVPVGDTGGDDSSAADDSGPPDSHQPDDSGADDSGGDDSGGADDSSGGDDSGDDDTGGGSSGGAPEFWPYVDATLYPVAKIAEIAEINGVMTYNLGFVVAASSGACEATWGTYYSIEDGPDSWDSGGEYFLYDQIDALRASGGDVAVAFGGAAGTPLGAACGDEDALQTELRRVVDTLDLTRLEFDVEGYWLADDASISRTNLAIAGLQADLAGEGRSLEVWFTLPVLPSGLTSDGVALIDDALGAGVDIGGINVMAMDYGDSAAPDPDGQMGEYAIEAATSLHDQMVSAWARAGLSTSSDALWAKVGVTPMIGLNDVTTETFTLDDAATLRAFSDSTGIGLLSMWSVNRDHACPGRTWVDTTCSSTDDQTEDWQFSAALGGG